MHFTNVSVPVSKWHVCCDYSIAKDLLCEYQKSEHTMVF